MEDARSLRIAEIKRKISILKMDERRLQSLLDSPNFRDSSKVAAKADFRRTAYLRTRLTEELNHLERE